MSPLMQKVKLLFTKRPFITNCLVCGSLYVAAELSQQVVTKKILAVPQEPLNKQLLGRYAIMGTFICSPLLYSWYKWLDKTFPGTSKQIIMSKVAMDQFVMGPILLVVFFVGMSVMELAPDPFRDCREQILPTFTKSFLFWVPARTINFVFIPPQYRMLCGAVCTFIWMNVLCWIKRETNRKLD